MKGVLEIWSESWSKHAPIAPGLVRICIAWIRKRMRRPWRWSPQSTGMKLLSRGVEKCSQKVGEEATEVVIEAIKGDRVGLIKESADLLYHLYVLWAAAGGCCGLRTAGALRRGANASSTRFGSAVRMARLGARQSRTLPSSAAPPSPRRLAVAVARAHCGTGSMWRVSRRTRRCSMSASVFVQSEMALSNVSGSSSMD